MGRAATGKDGLTEKQRRFVEAYMGEARGNGTRAAELAGYKGNRNTLGQVSKDNLRKRTVREAIDLRIDKDWRIATREECQQFWSDTMRDQTVDMAHRVKVSELLAKTQGVFAPPITNVYSVSQTITSSGNSQLRELAWREIVKERRELGLPLELGDGGRESD